MIVCTITCVYKNEKGVITAVCANGTKVSKFEVVTNIRKLGMRYIVPSCEKVHVVGDKYIRTDGNDIEEDNLGNLPLCSD